jgi:hypothetical protein
MELFYDERDDAAQEARGSQILYWLDDLGAATSPPYPTGRVVIPFLGVKP